MCNYKNMPQPWLADRCEQLERQLQEATGRIRSIKAEQARIVELEKKNEHLEHIQLCHDQVVRDFGDTIHERDSLAAHAELIKHKADNLNSMCAMAVGGLPNKSPVAESLVYWIKNWNNFKENSSPQTSLAEHDAEVARKALWAFHDTQEWSEDDDDTIYFVDQCLRSFADEYAGRVKRGEV